MTADAAGTVVRASRTYGQAGAPSVTRTTSNGATTGHQLSVLLTDHLGTANTAVSLTSGQAVTRRAFKPYGETRGAKPSVWPNKRGYLGVGIDDAATGLTHIGAREYDQDSGRFLSADPVIDIADPLQMNGYAYSGNSPVSHSDPSGLWCDSCNDGKGWTRPDGGTQGDPDGGLNSDGTVRGTPHGGGAGWENTVKWNASQTPRTNDIDELLKHFLMNSPNGDSPETDYWVTPVYENDGPGNACFGREACRQAYKYLLRHDDVAEAKRIAANYCVANFNECVADAKAFERGKLVEGFIAALVTGGRGSSAAWAVGKRGRAPIGCKCFLAGTDVLMADGTTKDIEDVELGDEVLATDPETGETGIRKVTRLIVTEDDKNFNELSIATASGIEKLTATHEHPFWSPSEQDWIEAGELTADMTLRTETGDTVIVTGNRSFTMHARTYNLTVDDLHTYYVLVGDTPVLVHNAGKDPVTPNIILRGLQQIQDGALQQRRNPDGTLDHFQNHENNKRNAWWEGAKIYAPDPNNNDYRILEKEGQFKWVGPKGNVKGAGHFYGKLMNIAGCN